VPRYETGLGDEFEPGSNGHVLRNHLGIVDPDVADQIESRLLSSAYLRSVEELDTETTFSVEGILDMHRDWLEPLYPFAGQLRAVDVSKDNFLFARAAFLREGLAGLDSILRRNTPCAGMDLGDLSFAIAEVHAELLFLHPFREGNGRLARWLADLMALQSGITPLDWGFRSGGAKARSRYFAALHRGYVTDYGLLTELVAEALHRGVHGDA